MKHVFIAVMMLMTGLVSAQDRSLLDRFYKNVSESCVDMSYSYSARVSGINNLGQGQISFQGLRWKLKGNGVEIYCDSVSTWILDTAMKEAVIEPAVQDPTSDVIANPALLLLEMEDIFMLEKVLSARDGKSLLFVMRQSGEGNIDYCNIELYKDNAALRHLTYALDDGTLIKIEVSSMKLTPKVSEEAFRPQYVFDSAWIVTDLR